MESFIIIYFKIGLTFLMKLLENQKIHFVANVKKTCTPCKTGKFAAMMDVSLINDGPVTFMIEK